MKRKQKLHKKRDCQKKKCKMIKNMILGHKKNRKSNKA